MRAGARHGSVSVAIEGSRVRWCDFSFSFVHHHAGRVAPGANLLLTGFGAGLTWSAHVLKWGERTSPLGTSDAELPPCTKSALEMVRGYIDVKKGSRYTG